MSSMKAISALVAGVLITSALAAPWQVHSRDDIGSAQKQVSNLTASALRNVLDTLNAREELLRKEGKTPSCTAKNLVFRKE